MTPAEFDRLKDEIAKDWRALHDWREEAKESYAFDAGEQYSDEEKAKMRDNGRVPVVFNRVAPIIDNVTGTEVKSRSEVAYLPREIGDAQKSEILTGAGEWFRDEADADTIESDAFRDAIICGIGWTDTRLDVDNDPQGEPFMERIDPLEMGYDRHASGRNLRDARRVFRVRRITREAAREYAEKNLSDEELDAGWIGNVGTTTERSYPGDDYDHNEEYGDNRRRDDGLVTVIQVQWRERRRFWIAERRDPMTGRVETIEMDDMRKAAAQSLMPDAQFAELKRWEVKQAFLGGKVLSDGKSAVQRGFTFNAITGKRDRNKRVFYGLMRGMKDPQRWHNNFMSMMMQILASNSKGGLLAEEGITTDHARFEREWAVPNTINWVPDGSLTDPAGRKIEAKPIAELPTGYERLMLHAQEAITATTGVNAEMIGMKDVNQSGVLEYQRREAAMTVLTSLFDSLRAYRRNHGRVMLEYILEYLSDGRLVRIVGDDGRRYVPLIRENGVAEYDIIVDEAASSPNSKERAWAAIREMLPIIGQMIGPQEMLELAKYSPLPASLVEKMGARMQEQEPDPAVEAMKQVELQGRMAKIQKDQADAAKTQVEAQVAGQGAAAEVALTMALANKATTEAEQGMRPDKVNVNV